jgi:hypothetical protein
MEKSIKAKKFQQACAANRPENRPLADTGVSPSIRMISTRILSGLPSYGPAAISFPPDWGHLGREGTVVEFKTEASTWVGNFQPGLGGVQFAGLHPNKQYAVVIADGDLWVVDTDDRTAQQLLPAIDMALEVQDPDGWVFSRQGLALARLGPGGLIWHTRRLSWDGFDQLSIDQGEVKGLAWSPIDDQWHPFHVDIRTGKATGGSFGDEDSEGWEKRL